jgi:hypothetical protein
MNQESTARAAITTPPDREIRLMGTLTDLSKNPPLSDVQPQISSPEGRHPADRTVPVFTSIISPRLREQGMQAADRVPFDFQAWFSIRPAGQRRNSF